MSKNHHKPLVNTIDHLSEDEEEDIIDLSSILVTKMKEMKRRSEGIGKSTDVTSKRAKKVSEEDENKIGECKERVYFHRLWSEEDEIVLLQGIIDFKGLIGKSPFEDRHTFVKLVKESISFDASVKQYMDKIRHLKRKYMMNKKVFSKAHDQKCFKLAKSIWGAEEKSKRKKVGSLKEDLLSSPNGSKVLLHGGDETNSDWFENSFLFRSVESLGVDSVKQKWSMVQIKTKKKLEEKLELLQAKELECKKVEDMLKEQKRECMKLKTDLLNDVISVISEAN